MSNSKIIRASEIGMYKFCEQSYLLLKSGVPAQQTLQDLIEQKKIPLVVAKELQQKNIPLNTTIDKIIGQGLLPPKTEKEIIQSNILLQGTAKHMDIGKQTRAGAGVQEHRGGYWTVLFLILMIMLFLMFMLIKGGI